MSNLTFEQISEAIAEAAASGRSVAIAPDAVRTLHQHLQQHEAADLASEFAVRWLTLPGDDEPVGIGDDLEVCDDEDDARRIVRAHLRRTELIRRDVRLGPWIRVVDEQQQARDHHPAGTPDTEGAHA